MNSREAILAAVRQRHIEAVELPAVAGDWITYPDRVQQFAEVLAGVGGLAVSVAEVAELDAAARALPVMSDAKKIICRVPGMTVGNVDLDVLAAPADLNNVDVAILPGEFAVAENAAVWVTDAGIRHRVVYFLPQHLVLVVRRDAVVEQMHAAYARLQFPDAGYGLFISGPSKTADIEQSLVIGAHGPRSLTVLLLGAYDKNSQLASGAAASKSADAQFTGY